MYLGVQYFFAGNYQASLKYLKIAEDLKVCYFYYKWLNSFSHLIFLKLSSNLFFFYSNKFY